MGLPPLLFNVSKLMAEPSGSSRVYAVDEDLFTQLGGDPKHVAGSVKLLRTDRGIWASVELDTETLCVCSRCLREFNQEVRVAIEEEFFFLFNPRSEQASGGITDHEQSFKIDSNNTLNLSEAVDQYLSLGIPLKPICRVACRGICAVCGSDKNYKECHCAEPAQDNRWTDLLELAIEARPETRE